jgi:hypothetical protein
MGADNRSAAPGELLRATESDLVLLRTRDFSRMRGFFLAWLEPSKVEEMGS